VVTQSGIAFAAGAWFWTTGTFLNGLIHIGSSNTRGPGGRSTFDFAGRRLADLGLPRGRLKTVPRRGWTAAASTLTV